MERIKLPLFTLNYLATFDLDSVITALNERIQKGPIYCEYGRPLILLDANARPSEKFKRLCKIDSDNVCGNITHVTFEQVDNATMIFGHVMPDGPYSKHFIEAVEAGTARLGLRGNQIDRKHKNLLTEVFAFDLMLPVPITAVSEKKEAEGKPSNVVAFKRPV